MGRTYNYERPRATAKKLIGKFGIEAELRMRGSGARYTVLIVFEDYKSYRIDGSRIKVGDFKGLIAASSLVPLAGAPPLEKHPDEGDMLFWGGKLRQIISGEVLRPGPQDVLYTVQIRGAR